MVLLITGDEEGDAVDGTAALLDWMDQHGERMDACLVGEPTCPDRMGEMIKIGRRGSMTAWITLTGVQGHSAYPHRAVNPVPAMARLADRLSSTPLDAGTDAFRPLDAGRGGHRHRQPANNVIPASAGRW